MRKFKLLKDLPGVPAGTVLIKNDGNNSLHLDNAAETVLPISLVGKVVYLSAMGIFTSDSSEWLEEIELDYKRWRAGFEKPYFYLNHDAKVLSSHEDYCSVDDDRHRYGNYFQTEEEAQAHADYLEALAVVRDDAKGFKPDWADDRQSKYYVCYLHEREGLCLFDDVIRRHADNGVFGLPYFETQEDAKASIEKHGEEWKTIFGIKDDEDNEGEYSGED